MQTIDFFSQKTEINESNYPQAMQQAIGIEIATIPVYLYTYYSINRTPDQDAIIQDLVQRLVTRKNDPVGFDEAGVLAQELSAQIMVFANYAGAGVVSVAIEEMLHMSLSGNVHQSTIGPPKFAGVAPTQWPAILPGHEPPFLINRAGFCLDQLKTFLLIESPDPIAPTAAAEEPATIEYVTIGEFYQSIIDYLADPNSPVEYDSTRPQLAPGNGYYAQNNINTNYYNKKHQQKFLNAEDSGNLVFVNNAESACKALYEIKEQGEGCDAPGLGPDNEPICDEKLAFDDHKHEELTHFAKFNLIWCKLRAMEAEFKTVLQDDTFDVKKYFVYNVPENPSTSDYPENIQSMSNLLNAVYSYTFIMTESCYNVHKPVQFEIFTGGIHKTMMWILGTLCGTIVAENYTGADGQLRAAAPTFEEYAFNTASNPKAQIQALYTAMAKYYPDTNVGPRIDSLPDIPISGKPDVHNTTVFA